MSCIPLNVGPVGWDSPRRAETIDGRLFLNPDHVDVGYWTWHSFTVVS